MSHVVPLFPLGRIVATPGALDALAQAEQSAEEFLTKHARGEWGTGPEEDRQENEYAVFRALRLLSSYRLRTGETIWLITEADRSATTLLLPQEY